MKGLYRQVQPFCIAGVFGLEFDVKPAVVNIFVSMRTVFLLGLFLAFMFPAVGRQKVYDFNPRCQQAYDAIMQLKVTAGTALLEAEKKELPTLHPIFH